mgnify:CR=1 FL=1
MSKSKEALALVDSGVSPSAAAKELGISRQAVDDALRRRKAQANKPMRQCSECGATLPSDARMGATTCSIKCRVAKSRRCLREMKANSRASINAERLKLGLPPIGHDRV